MKTVVMTGATSFLGRNVLKGLLNEDYKLYALVRRTSNDLKRLPQNESVRYIYGSLGELENIEREVSHADYFLHFAWDGSGYLGRKNGEIQFRNVEYSMEALRLAEKLGCKKFIFSGSQAEYGIIDGRITENTACKPISEYGKAKLLFSEQAEEFCKDIKLKFWHLRIFSVYGPDDREGTLVDSCVRKFNLGEFMQLGPCKQKWNFLYISDFVRVIKRILISSGAGGTYNIASQDIRVLKEFVEEIYSLSNQTGGYTFGEADQNPEKSPSLDADISKITDETGWKPTVSFSEGILRMMESVLGGIGK